MSHATVLVALDPEAVEKLGRHAAIAHEMEPFDENGTFFREGSRWDWWVVGGRFSGKFAPPGYDPSDDDRNLEPCFCCNATGRRTDAVGTSLRAADPNFTCNACGGKGKCLKHAGAWIDVGNQVTRGELNLATWAAARKAEAEGWWAEYEKALAEAPANGGPGWRFGVEPGDTRETYVARRGGKPVSCHAFLRNREWHELGRMGWFGSVTATECEQKAGEAGVPVREGRCITKDAKTGAKVYSWNKADDVDDAAEAEWGRLFFDRFLKDLPPDTLLVVVDFHV